MNGWIWFDRVWRPVERRQGRQAGEGTAGPGTNEAAQRGSSGRRGGGVAARTSLAALSGRAPLALLVAWLLVLPALAGFGAELEAAGPGAVSPAPELAGGKPKPQAVAASPVTPKRPAGSPQAGESRLGDPARDGVPVRLAGAGMRRMPARAGELIVKPKPGSGPRAALQALQAVQALERQPGLRVERTLSTGAALVRVEDPARTGQVMAALRRSGRYAYVQPNYIYRLAVLPGDPRFGEQWGLHNEGQAVQGQQGTPDVDIEAPEAWDVTRGSAGVTVAVIDTGIDFSHPDLAGAAWVNGAEAAGRPGVDDDRNGYVDDINGYDFWNRDGTVFDPEDGDEHGTHVAGIIAARWGNGEGVAGVAPGVRIMALKAFGPGGDGTTAEAVEAIAYAERMGARIVNLSWGGPEVDPALADAIARSRMLFVASAGNEASDNDVAPYYPASYESDNVIAVAAADNRGQLAWFSNYGRSSVDLAAPGQDILSTVPPLVEIGGAVQVDTGDYKAVVLGFGLEDVDEPGARRTLLGAVLDFFGLDRAARVLLVDDDGSNYAAGGGPAGGSPPPDVSSVYETALLELGQAFERREVAAPGPASLADLDPAAYPAVIWFTGHSWGFPEAPNLTPEDLVALAGYLERGGRLLLAGQDAAFGNEDTGFYLYYLQTRFAGEETARTELRPAPGSLFGAAGYRLALPAVAPVLPDRLEPAGPDARRALVYPAEPGRLYAYQSGTSMAAPHVTGVAALVASRYPWLSAAGIRSQLLATGKDMPALEGKVAVPRLPSARAAIWEEPAEEPVFSDVSPKLTLYEEIRRAAALGLVQGYPGGRFGPGDKVTRSQLAKMIVNAYERATGVILPIDPGAGFPDVDENDGNLGPYVAKAATAGWIQGYPDGTFRPAEPVSRLQAAVIVARVLELPPAAGHPFADLRSRFDGQVGAVAEAGIMKGIPSPDGTGTLLFRPNDVLTRAQAAAVAVRVYDYLTRAAP